MSRKNNSQLLNFVLITLGGGCLLVGITAEKDFVFLKIVGIVLLMLGLYRATNVFITSEEERKKNESDKNNDGTSSR